MTTRATATYTFEVEDTKNHIDETYHVNMGDTHHAVVYHQQGTGATAFGSVTTEEARKKFPEAWEVNGKLVEDDEVAEEWDSYEVICERNDELVAAIAAVKKDNSDDNITRLLNAWSAFCREDDSAIPGGGERITDPSQA